MRTEKLDNETHSNLHIPHVIAIFSIFEKLSGKRLRAEEICYKTQKWLLFLQF